MPVAAPGIGVVSFTVSEDGPHDAHMFVCDGDEGLVIADAAVQGDDPLLESRTPEGLALEGYLQCRASALGQQSS